MMIFLSLRVTADAGGGLKGPAQMRRSLQGFGGDQPPTSTRRYIPAHCLPSSATTDSQALLLIIFLLLFHQSGITKELFPGRNSQFVVDILVVKL